MQLSDGMHLCLFLNALFNYNSDVLVILSRVCAFKITSAPLFISLLLLHFFFLENMAHHSHLPKYIFRNTAPVPEDTPKVKGYDFNQGVDYHTLLQSYLKTGLQATNIGLAIQQINKMVRWVAVRVYMRVLDRLLLLQFL